MTVCISQRKLSPHSTLMPSALTLYQRSSGDSESIWGTLTRTRSKSFSSYAAFSIHPDSRLLLTDIQWFWLSVIFYNIGLGLTKISILMQYLRIFATTTAMRYATLATLAFVILYTLEAILLSIFSCTPVDLFWNRTKTGHCVDFKALWFTHAALNIFSDVLIISLPMPVIKNLNIPRKQKFALMAIFALGAL